MNLVSILAVIAAGVGGIIALVIVCDKNHMDNFLKLVRSRWGIIIAFLGVMLFTRAVLDITDWADAVALTSAIVAIGLFGDLWRAHIEQKGKVKQKALANMQSDINDLKTIITKLQQRDAEREEQIADLYIQQHNQREEREAA